MYCNCLIIVYCQFYDVLSSVLTTCILQKPKMCLPSVIVKEGMSCTCDTYCVHCILFVLLNKSYDHIHHNLIIIVQVLATVN